MLLALICAALRFLVPSTDLHAQSPGRLVDVRIRGLESDLVAAVSPSISTVRPGTRSGTLFERAAEWRSAWQRARVAPGPGSLTQHGPEAGPSAEALIPAFHGEWRFQQPDNRINPGLALLASAALPGAGQFLQDNDRWVPYLALEIWGWLSFADRRSDAHDLADDYRDLAWFVARRVSVGDRRDSIFEYYEEMTHFASSGTFDSDPEAEGIQPEFDGRTFNGYLWALARGLYFGGSNPQPGTEAYQQALDYYLSRAISPTFTWAWGDSFLEQQSFRELIRRSDEAYRTSTQFLGLLLANHVVSAVDALVIGRLRGAGAESRLRVGSGFEPGRGFVPRLRIEASWRW